MDSIKDIAKENPVKWEKIAEKIDENFIEVGGIRTVQFNENLTTTRLQIKISERKYGLILVYKHPEFGNIQEKYIGDEIGDIEWVKDENWKEILDEDKINTIIEENKTLIDNDYSLESENPIQNKIITKTLINIIKWNDV